MATLRLGSRALRGAASLLVLILVTAAACGGNGERESEEQREGERTLVECDGSAVTPDLPADFPTVSGVTFTKSTSAGPTQVADGYYEGTLEDAYENFRTAIRKAGYDVIFDEIEEEDSEVAYSGGRFRRSGIVALRENCSQGGRISVHITSRPE